MKDDSESAVFESGEKEVWKEVILGGGGGVDEGRLVEEGIKREWMKVGRRQERRGDKTSTLQPRVMISCQALTSSPRFR